MQHYSWHIGDYIKDTAHLSDAEDLGYRRMIDLYYTIEGPLPLDLKALCRRARVSHEVAEQLLSEFFTRTEEGFRHARCDRELDAIYSKSESARKSAESRWEKQRNANAMRTHSEGNANTMLPITQDPIPIESTALSGKPDGAQANGKKKLSESCIEVLEFLNEKTGRRYQPVKANINLIAARLREGATVTQCRQVIAKKCREWRDDPNQEIYLRPKTLFNATNFANYQGEVAPNE